MELLLPTSYFYFYFYFYMLKFWLKFWLKPQNNQIN